MINAEENNEGPIRPRDNKLSQSARMKVKRRPALFFDLNKNDSEPDVTIRHFHGLTVNDPMNLDLKQSVISSEDESSETNIDRNFRNCIDNAAIEESLKGFISDKSDADSPTELPATPFREFRTKRSESAENLLSVLLTVNDVKSNRLHHIKKLLDHENEHLHLLTTIQQYKYILQESKVSDEIVWNIFYNISDLIYAQKSLVSYLESLTTDWDTKPVHFVEIMELYTLLHIKCKDYVKNISVACRELKILFDKNEKFRNAIDVITFDRKVIRLEVLITKPINWLCNSMEHIKTLIETAEGENDRKTLVKTLEHLKSHSEENTKTKTPLELKNNFLRSSLFVEQLSNDLRKLRHVFLFSGMIVCAKQKLPNPSINPKLFNSEQDEKGSASKELFEIKTVERFEVKWFIPLKSLVFHNSKNVESTDRRKNEITSLKEKIRDLKVQLMTEKDKLNSETESQSSKYLKRTKSNSFVFRKMMVKKEIEKISHQILKIQTDLLLISPTIPFVISSGPEKLHTLLVQSIKDLEVWKCEILKVQREQKDTVCSSMSIASVNNLLEDFRRYQSINEMATSPLSYHDGVSGMLIATINKVSGLNPEFKYQLSVEVDSFKLIELKARTKANFGASTLSWNESFDIDLDCSHTINILLYEIKNYGESKESLVGFFEFQLKSKDLYESGMSKNVPTLSNESAMLNIECSFKLEVKGEQMKRQPSIMKAGLFGINLKSIVSREKSRSLTVIENVPIILVHGTKNIEDRGIDEEGIYRISGSKNEIMELYKRLNKNVENALKNVDNYDLHTITGIVKMFLRELPEPLMMSNNYEELLRITKLEDESERFKLYQEVLQKLPEPNFSTMSFLLRHFEKVCDHSNKNQMIAGNLGLIFGPTLIMPPCDDPIPKGNNIAFETMHRMLLARVFTHIMHGLCNRKITMN